MALRRLAAFAASALAGVCITLFGLFLPLWAVGTDAALYHELQSEADVTQTAGVDDATLTEVDALLADCLRGNERAFLNEDGSVRRLRVFDAEQEVFNERERVHMEDCRRLFVLLKRALLLTGVCGVLLSLLCALVYRRERAVRAGFGIAPFLPLLPAAALGIWACADFDAAFRFFHGLLFTNDLWLLDPATDLLIRICPESMFSAMGLRIAGFFLAWVVLYRVTYHALVRNIFGRKIK